MATIVTIAAGDQITNSRADINTNFANLNSDKIETSALDTDTSLAANSDAKIPSQKAVKAYVDAGGNVNASETTKGIVEIATQAEVNAGTATGGTGASIVVTPETLKAVTSPVVQTYLTAGSPATWTKPAGLKYVVVEVQAGGGAGAAGTDEQGGGGGGGGGGFSRKLIAAATLGATETVTTGAAGASSSFGTHATATPGSAGVAASAGGVGGAGGIGSGGDVNVGGNAGSSGGTGSSVRGAGGSGGASHLGGGGVGAVSQNGGGTPTAGQVYGGGGGGGSDSGSGAAGAAGIVIVTEYYV